MKKYTIPDAIENLASVSAYVRTYPFMAHNPKWLYGLPITERCKELYPEIVHALQAESRPCVISITQSTKPAIAA